MKFSQKAFRGLVIANTIVLGAFVAVAVFAGLLVQDRIRPVLASYVEREIASSKVLESIHHEPTNLDGDKSQGNSTQAGSGDVSHEPIPLYAVKIHPSDLRQIQQQVQQLVKQKILTDDQKIWYPTTLSHGHEKYKGKIRLKGDLANHWAEAKKSWRIKFKRDKLLDAKREVDFNIPSDKGYEVEQVAYEAARALGLLVPHAGFCKLSINGVDMGLYHWIEKYGKTMLERLGYPEGEIFRYDNVWTQTRYNGLGVSPKYHASSFKPTIRKPGDPDLGYWTDQWHRFVTLIREADNETFHKTLPHKVNMEKYLAWNALTWLFGSTHCHWGDNLRWYYDNTTGQFEPILYDIYRYPVQLPGDAGEKPLWKFESHETDLLARRVMQIPQYQQQRNEILWKLVTDERFNVAARCEQWFQRIRPHLLTGAGARLAYSIDHDHEQTIKILATNRQQLREHLSFARVFNTPIMTMHQGVPTLVLEILPDSRAQLTLDHLRLRTDGPLNPHAMAGPIHATLHAPDGKTSRVIPVTATQPEDGLWQLAFEHAAVWNPVDETLQQQPAQWTLRIQLPAMDPRQWQTPGLITGVDTSFTQSLTRQRIADPYRFSLPMVYQFSTQADHAATAATTGTTHSTLPLVEKDGHLVLAAGDYVLRQTVVLSQDMPVKLEAGVTLRLGPGVSVISYQPIQAAGTADRPVRIEPLEPNQPWGSFAVVRAPGRSRLQYLQVQGGSEAYTHGLYLSGQLCFYASDVDLLDCRITHALADDGLNIKKSQFSIQRCLFEHNASDAFDGDWVRGQIHASIFRDNKGDSVDFSGSEVTIWDCLTTRSGDKAISAGEKSTVLCYNSVIRESHIAVASKDLSVTQLYACVLYKNDTAVTAYRKKPIFGGGRGRAVGCLLWDNATDFTIDERSRFNVASIAVQNWQPTDRVTEEAVLLGDLPSAYLEHPSGLVTARTDADARSMFIITTPTHPLETGAITIPDLEGKPAGLGDPSRLEQALSTLWGDTDE